MVSRRSSRIMQANSITRFPKIPTGRTKMAEATVEAIIATSARCKVVLSTFAKVKVVRGAYRMIFCLAELARAADVVEKLKSNNLTRKTILGHWRRYRTRATATASMISKMKIALRK
jgi:hypothetical protein